MGAPVSLRVGRSAGLTRHRRVIQYRGPPRGKALGDGGRSEKCLPWLKQAVAEASAPVNAGIVLLSDNDTHRTNSARSAPPNLHDPQRAKGSLDRRSKRLSFPHFFLRRKKCGRRRLAPAGATPAYPRAKGSLNRRFEWFSLVTFFLQKKKVTRAGARNSPSRARRREIIPVGDK